VQHKRFIYAGGKLITLNTQAKDSAHKLKNKQVRYLHFDAVDMITDGHEHVEEVGLIHMNGCVYDQELGRF